MFSSSLGDHGGSLNVYVCYTATCSAQPMKKSVISSSQPRLDHTNDPGGRVGLSGTWTKQHASECT